VGRDKKGKGGSKIRKGKRIRKQRKGG